MNNNDADQKYIINHLYGSAEHTLFNPNDRDNCTEPYIKLKQKCEELGYIFEGTNNQCLDECKWLLFWDCSSLGQTRYRIKAKLHGYPTRNIFREAIASNMQNKLVLFLFEPPSACPENYDFKLHKEFSIIFTWDPTLVDGEKYHRIYLPSPTKFERVTPLPFSRKKLLVNISSYKFSSHVRELYSETRRTIRFFEQHYPNQFDLYGFLWNPNFKQYLMRKLTNPKMLRETYPSYRGIVANKWELYGHYKFGLCYENMVDQPGYISLKIFDCLRSGCVPVYLGAPDIADYVDKAAFIDRRSFVSLDDLGTYLSVVGEAEYKRYIDAGKAYLNSARFKLFLSDNFVETIISTLQIQSLK